MSKIEKTENCFNLCLDEARISADCLCEDVPDDCFESSVCGLCL